MTNSVSGVKKLISEKLELFNVSFLFLKLYVNYNLRLIEFSFGKYITFRDVVP